MARIVAADDDPEIGEVVKESLDGHTVLLAPDGRAALDLIRTEKPDLVIVDVMMPHRDGFSVCRAVKADPALARTRILMLTAQEKMARFERAGVPVAKVPSEIPGLIAAALRKKRPARLELVSRAKATGSKKTTAVKARKAKAKTAKSKARPKAKAKAKPTGKTRPKRAGRK